MKGVISITVGVTTEKAKVVSARRGGLKSLSLIYRGLYPVIEILPLSWQ